DAVVRAEDLGRGVLRRGREDLADGRALEVLVRRVPDELDRRGVRREVADVREDRGLLLGVGQPRDELGRLLLVLTGRGDAEVGAAPVAALPAREGGDVPLAAAGVAGLALDVADHPGGAGDRGEGAAAEAGVPARVDELLELGGEAVLPGLGGEVERVAEGLVRLED